MQRSTANLHLYSMKKLLIISTAVLSLTVAHGQNYPPIINNSCWYVNVSSFAFSGDFWIIQDKDTFIAPYTYKKFIDSASGQQMALIREDVPNKKVYRYKNNSDILLFDFSLQLTNTITLPNGLNYVVDWVDSINVSNGGKTRWANFYHGIFILIFLIFAVQFSDLIPKAALAAMLIGVGFKLAHPREFGHMAKIGWDQVVVFITTIIFTLVTDLLIGIAAGIIIKLILHLINGAPIENLFSAKTKIEGNKITVQGAAVFSNFIGIKKKIDQFPLTDSVIFDVRECKLIDHSVIENLHHIKDDFVTEGGSFKIVGIDEFKPATKSKHKLAAVKKK